MDTNENVIQIFTIEHGGDSEAYEVKRGAKSFAGTLTAKAAEVKVGVLEENMTRFIDCLDAIVNRARKEIGGLTLDEIEIHASIDGKGNIGIAGIGGAELSAGGGIKLVLRKKT